MIYNYDWSWRFRNLFVLIRLKFEMTILNGYNFYRPVIQIHSQKTFGIDKHLYDTNSVRVTVFQIEDVIIFLNMNMGIKGFLWKVFYGVSSGFVELMACLVYRPSMNKNHVLSYKYVH